ncbi:hypothetical protein HDF09_004023 [Edaphobacter lichenicola]|uniref:Uncharacterized protein n=1 Tax=Tunturiibacter empetritectus TaxID=3069691 RepID=A0A7W8MTC9_9BACT|nr:hypothetical protein [Edaphobacter lichenicola]
MMHYDGSLATTRGSAYPTAIAVTLQNSLAKPAEVLLILPLKRVARRTEAMRENSFIPASAVHCSLDPFFTFLP